MNSMIGKSTGIALLMAAALLAALFAMGVFSPTGVGAAAQPPMSVTYTTDDATSAGDTTINLVIGFQLAGDLAASTAGNEHTITLPLGDYAPNWTALATPPSPLPTPGVTLVDRAGATVAQLGTSPATYSADGKSVTITMDTGATLDATGSLNNSVITATIATDAITGVMAPGNDVISNCFGAGQWAADMNDPDAVDQALATAELATKNISSCEPGAPVRIDLADTATAEIAVNQDIVVELNANPLRKFSVPSTLSESGVLIVVGGNASIPQEVSVGANNVINITLADSNPATVAPEPITAGAAYSIVFKQSAGITNPAGAGSAAIKITGGGSSDTHGVAIQRVIKVDTVSGKRGAESTATLKGFSNGTTAVYVEGTEVGQADITSNSGTIALNTASGAFGAGDNEITATDASGTSQDVSANFNLLPTVTLTPSDTAVSRPVTVKVSDWTPGETISSVSIGAVPAPITGTPTVGSTGAVTGTATFTITVPSNVNRGTQTVRVTDSSGTSSTASLKINVLPLSIQPASAVPGQEITITGTGFMGGDTINTVSIGGNPVTLTPAAVASSAGNIVITTMPPSLAPGMKTVKVQASPTTAHPNNSDRIAEGKLEIPAASISLSPEEGRRETTVNVSGSGFPARAQIQVDYAGTVVVSVPSDSSGVFNASFVVPPSANIGAPHTVTATSQSNVFTDVSAIATHRTPGAVLKLSADQISRGAQLTITGENFPVFAVVAEMTIGDQDVRPVPAPATSVNGDFTATVLVPGLTLGNQTVRVRVQDTDITDFIQISDAPASNDPADVFAGVVATGRLSRVWFLDAENQEWLFYDPDPEVADFNDLNEVTAGKAYIIIVTEGDPVEFQGRSLYQGTNNIPLR